nr:MAG TPA: hypothetical protein [Caudoviricetes sp.]
MKLVKEDFASYLGGTNVDLSSVVVTKKSNIFVVSFDVIEGSRADPTTIGYEVVVPHTAVKSLVNSYPRAQQVSLIKEILSTELNDKLGYLLLNKEHLIAIAITKLLELEDKENEIIEHSTLSFTKEKSYYRITAKADFTVQGTTIIVGTVGGRVACPALLGDNVWIDKESVVEGVSYLENTLVTDKSELNNVLVKDSILTEVKASFTVIKDSKLTDSAIKHAIIKDSIQQDISLDSFVMNGCKNQLNLYSKHKSVSIWKSPDPVETTFYLAPIRDNLQNFVSVSGITNGSVEGSIDIAVFRTLTGDIAYIFKGERHYKENLPNVLGAYDDELYAEMMSKILEGMEFMLRQKHYHGNPLNGVGTTELNHAKEYYQRLILTPLEYWKGDIYAILLQNSKAVYEFELVAELSELIENV